MGARRRRRSIGESPELDGPQPEGVVAYGEAGAVGDGEAPLVRLDEQRVRDHGEWVLGVPHPEGRQEGEPQQVQGDHVRLGVEPQEGGQEAPFRVRDHGGVGTLEPLLPILDRPGPFGEAAVFHLFLDEVVSHRRDVIQLRLQKSLRRCHVVGVQELLRRPHLSRPPRGGLRT